MNTKICTKCGQEFPATLEFFHKSIRGRYNLQAVCKSCCSKKSKQFYIANRQKIRETHKRYRKNNPEKMRASRRAWNLKHSEELKIMRKKWDSINRDKIRKRKMGYYKENQIRISATHKKYRAKNQEKFRSYNLHYKARKRNATVQGFGAREFCKWLDSQRPFTCFLCGIRIKDGEPYHVDHRIPLSRGGPHSSSNLGITCPDCNLSKYNKTPAEFLPDRFRPELPL